MFARELGVMAVAAGLLGCSTDDVEQAAPGIDAASGAADASIVGVPPIDASPDAAPATYINPVLGQSCPDPGVLAVPEQSRYYMACTSGTYPIWQSSDLVAWEPSGAAILPVERRPAWATTPFWAPEIHRIGDRYVAYFTARIAPAGRLAIGAASADDPLGPYVPLDQPLVQDPTVSMIDSHQLRASDGRRYLYWKSNGNALDPPQPTHIYGQELAADGLSLVGERVSLLVNDLTWEALVIEAPWVVERGGQFYLFYSGNVYDARYRTGVARAGAPLGPYQKRGEPILGSNDSWQGPGHGSVVEVAGRDFFVYHGWSPDQRLGRMVLLDAIEWQTDGWPAIHDGTPSVTELPAP